MSTSKEQFDADTHALAKRTTDAWRADELADMTEDLNRAHAIAAEALGQNVNLEGQIAPAVTIMANLLASRQEQICELSARVAVSRIAVVLHTTDYRGDHSAEVSEIVDLKAGETVEQLVKRLLVEKRGGGFDKPHHDWIELRITKSAEAA